MAETSQGDKSDDEVMEEALAPGSAVSKPGTINYTSKQREWMFAAICQARGQLKKAVMYDHIEDDVLVRATEILLKHQYFSKVSTRPAKTTLRKIWKVFWQPEKTIDKIQRGGRPAKKAPPTKAATAAEAKAKSTTSNGRTSRTKSELHLGFYRMYRPHKLTEPLMRCRQEFVELWLRRLERREISLSSIIFTGELIVGVNPHLSKSQDGVWRMRAPQDNLGRLSTKSALEDVVHIWLGINRNLGVLGPYFLDDLGDPEDPEAPAPAPAPAVELESNMDGEASQAHPAPVPSKTKKNSGLPRVLTEQLYKDLLEKHVIKDLSGSVSRHAMKTNYWWYQDMCGPRVRQAPMALLRATFGQKVLAPFNCDSKCPVRSADLNPLEYAFLDHLTAAIREKRPCSIAQIKQAARGAKGKLSPLVKSIIDAYPTQLRACREYRGGRFEAWLADYKDRVRSSGLCAPCSDNPAGTLCDNCTRLLFACIERDRELENHHEARNPIYENDADDVIEPLPIN